MADQEEHGPALNAKTVEHFAPIELSGAFKGITAFATPHPKFVSDRCINNKGVTNCIGGSKMDRKLTPSCTAVVFRYKHPS